MGNCWIFTKEEASQDNEIVVEKMKTVEKSEMSQIERIAHLGPRERGTSKKLSMHHPSNRKLTFLKNQSQQEAISIENPPIKTIQSIDQSADIFNNSSQNMGGRESSYTGGVLLSKKSILSLPLRTVFDDSIIMNNVMHYKYLRGVSKDVLARGARLQTSEETTTLFNDVPGKNKGFKGLETAVSFTKEEDGFYCSKIGENLISLMMQETSFFLNKGMEIEIGEPGDPEVTLTIQRISFPKLRVNFNGHRIKTQKLDNNSSKFYVPYEQDEGEEKQQLVLGIKKGGGASSKEFIVVEAGSLFQVSGKDDSDLKIKKLDFLAKIRYIEQIGWIISSSKPDFKKSLYGAYVKNVSDSGDNKFKLYQGMKLMIADQHLLEITSFEQQKFGKK